LVSRFERFIFNSFIAEKKTRAHRKTTLRGTIYQHGGRTQDKIGQTNSSK